jgi:hypothetical protein
VKNIHSHSPPIASGAATSVHETKNRLMTSSPWTKCTFSPLGRNSGEHEHEHVDDAHEQHQYAMRINWLGRRLRLRESSSSHGTKKWNVDQEQREVLPSVADARTMYGILRPGSPHTSACTGRS